MAKPQKGIGKPAKDEPTKLIIDDKQRFDVPKDLSKQVSDAYKSVLKNKSKGK